MKWILLSLMCVGLGAITDIGLAASSNAETTSTAPHLASQAARERADFQEVLQLTNTASDHDDNYQHANQIVRQMLAANPRSAYGYAAMAELYYMLHTNGYPISSEEVQAIAQNAITLNPRLADPHTIMARLFLDEGRPRDAKLEADAAYRLAPRKPESLFVEARVSVALGHWSRAESFYKEDIAVLSPNTARQSNIYFWLSQMYLQESPTNVDAAGRALKSSADIDPHNPDAAIRYADFLINRTRDLDGIEQYARQALKINDCCGARIDLSIALYGKWAENYLKTNEHGNAKPDIPNLKAIQTRTGITPEYIFGRESETKNLGFITQALLEAGVIKNVDLIPPGNTNTAFVGAAYANNFKLAKLLLEHGANINSADKDYRFTALMYFLKNNNLEAVDYLLDHGARVNVVAGSGNPLVQLAIAYGQSHGPEMVDQLLAHGADPTITDKKGENLLFTATEANQARLVTVLAHRYKMNVNARNSDGNTPLAMAAMSSGPHKEAVNALLAAGATPWIYYDNADDILNEMDGLGGPLYPDTRTIRSMIKQARQHYPKPKGFATPNWPTKTSSATAVTR